MSTSPPPRVALVTGGARGIGAAIARGLADDGMATIIADIRVDRARENAERIVGTGACAMAVGMDVRSPESVAAGIEQGCAELGDVDVLVNVAGWDELKPFVDTDEEFWQEVLEVNFKGGLRLTKALLPSMTERGWGRIVNISSDAGRVGSSLESVYAGAKGAIISFTKTLARETARTGVTANIVCPGPTNTEMLQDVAAAHPDAEKVLERLARAVPMKRLGQPEDVAAAVRFFASEQASYITGQTLSVSGGLTMA
ncbi:MAG TPA: 3-oxoacyl-ACP reductase family protein [Solirubrobacteraceae bacterium]|jgi:2-hydroxycyclohexanecarboxyl-CoA dehydrogenase|nr:3-oxoacyl-ACP reductase family protein [Solirubrobacteraceae bacterium]